MGGVESESAYLVATSFVRDVFNSAVDVVHRVGLGGNVLFGGLGDGVVLGYVCHCGCLFVYVEDYVMLLVFVCF